jgi:hypothetical protein
MATYTWTATAPGNWGTTTNWTPNGTPTAADTVLFNSANNGDCTVAANATAQTLDFQDYVGVVTINGSFTLTVAGNLGLSVNSAFTIKPDVTGLGTLVISANSVIRSRGRTIQTILRFSTINTTIQLADAMILSRGLTIQGTPSGFINLGSSAPGVQRSLTLLNNGITDQDIDYANVSDINGNLGLTVWNYSGLISSCNNWIIMTKQAVPVSGFAIN